MQQPPWQPPLPPTAMPPYMHHGYGQYPLPPYMFPPLPPVDPDAAWLAHFTAQHLPQHQSQPPRTLRDVRQALLECLQRIRECKFLQEEMDRFAETFHATDDNELAHPTRARTKLQYERRRAALTATLARLRSQYSAFFDDKDSLKQVTAVAHRVRRKKLYRRRAKRQNQVHRHVLQNITSAANKESTPPLSPRGASVRSASCRMQLDETCKKLKLLQQLRAARGGGNDDALTSAVDSFLNEAALATQPPPPPVPKHSTGAASDATPHIPSKTSPRSSTHHHPLLEHDMTIESLVAVRRAWDSHLSGRGGSRIPPHFVIPPAPSTRDSSSPWHAFVVPVAPLMDP